MRKMMLAGATALAMVSTAALASVTFDPATGTGFVGKGDVQTAFGWNNAVAQTNSTSVNFSVDASVVYDVTCEWTTETGGKNSKTITHTKTKHHDLSDSLALSSDARKTGQYTGWNLNGYTDGGSLDTADLPAVGDSCPQGGSASDNDPSANDAEVTVVDVISNSTVLNAEFGGVAKILLTL